MSKIKKMQKENRMPSPVEYFCSYGAERKGVRLVVQQNFLNGSCRISCTSSPDLETWMLSGFRLVSVVAVWHVKRKY